MSLPYSRNTTYVATTTPSIKAADLNDVQDSIANAFNTQYFTPPVLGVNTPQTQYKDTAGNVRSLVDANGFPLGRYDEIREEWLFLLAESNNGGRQAPNSPIWFARTSANAAIDSVYPTNAYPAAGVKLTPGTANTNNVSLNTIMSLFPSDLSSIIMEFEFFMTISNTSNVNWVLGLSSDAAQNIDSTTGHSSSVAFYSGGGGAALWQAKTSDTTGAPTIVTLSTSPSNNVYQRLRLEFHGKSTPYGVAAIEGGAANTAKARFFIDGLRKLTTTTTVPFTSGFYPEFRGTCIGVATATGTLGPVRVVWNRYASIDAL